MRKPSSEDFKTIFLPKNQFIWAFEVTSMFCNPFFFQICRKISFQPNFGTKGKTFDLLLKKCAFSQKKLTKILIQTVFTKYVLNCE
jgi:hypothetical protein